VTYSVYIKPDGVTRLNVCCCRDLVDCESECV